MITIVVRKSCLFCHEQGSGSPTSKHRIKFLRNEIEQVHLDSGHICFGTIDSEIVLHYPPEEGIQFLNNGSPAIMLIHNPLIFNSIDNDQDVLSWPVIPMEVKYLFLHGYGISLGIKKMPVITRDFFR